MKSISLVYTGQNRKIIGAIERTNQVFKDPEFYSMIASYKEFETGCASPAIISRIMKESDHRIEVHSSRVVSFLKGSSFERFYISESMQDLSTGMLVNHLTQQTVAAMDKLYGFSKKGLRHSGIRAASLIIAAIAQSIVNAMNKQEAVANGRALVP